MRMMTKQTATSNSNMGMMNRQTANENNENVTYR